mmetsp:Transcript_104469/g.302276  ORF Transcript_104469/g.302276 Transcript_104469/m.302276 type:complete len:202 (-) Transcript_104469:49-654(-)
MPIPRGEDLTTTGKKKKTKMHRSSFGSGPATSLRHAAGSRELRDHLVRRAAHQQTPLQVLGHLVHELKVAQGAFGRRHVGQVRDDELCVSRLLAHHGIQGHGHRELRLAARHRGHELLAPGDEARRPAAALPRHVEAQAVRGSIRKRVFLQVAEGGVAGDLADEVRASSLSVEGLGDDPPESRRILVLRKAARYIGECGRR